MASAERMRRHGNEPEQSDPGAACQDNRRLFERERGGGGARRGRVVFDMRTARYAVGAQHGRCLLQLWSDERNVVRTVLAVEERAHCLRLTTRKMGAPKPQSLELAPTSDRRTPSTRETMRRNYQRLLERALTRNFPGWKVDGMRSAMDLEHSFGPAYARGRLLKGNAACAVIGVGSGGVGRAGERDSDTRDSVAGLLPGTRRQPAAFWRAQGGGSGRRVADDGGTDGLAQSGCCGVCAVHAG